MFISGCWEEGGLGVGGGRNNQGPQDSLDPFSPVCKCEGAEGGDVIGPVALNIPGSAPVAVPTDSSKKGLCARLMFCRNGGRPGLRETLNPADFQPMWERHRGHG